MESPSSFFSPALLLPGSPVGSSSVKPWGETEKRKWNAPSSRASSVPGNDIQRTLSPPWFPLFGGSGVSGATANTRIFLFLKKALQWIIHTIISAKLCWSILSLLRVSVNIPRPFSPPPYLPPESTERVKKTKPFFPFFFFFSVYLIFPFSLPTAHSLSAFFPVVHRQNPPGVCLSLVY